LTLSRLRLIATALFMVLARQPRRQYEFHWQVQRKSRCTRPQAPPQATPQPASIHNPQPNKTVIAKATPHTCTKSPHVQLYEEPMRAVRVEPTLHSTHCCIEESPRVVRRRRRVGGCLLERDLANQSSPENASCRECRQEAGPVGRSGQSSAR
jgi:hypothetical protein